MMDYSNYNYCQFDYTLIKKVFSEAFQIQDFEKVINAYETFKQDFDNKSNSNLFTTLARTNCLPITNDHSFLQSFRNSEFTTGIDLPVLISKKGRNNTENSIKTKPCIFIVGEDPLRPNNCQNPEIVLSTPYGTHSEYKDKKGKLYWLFSKRILELGYSIYYTDIKKLWVKKSGINKLKIPRDLSENFSKCLYEEIQIFGPKMIITFGKEAESSVKLIHRSCLTNLDNPPQIISYIHPAARASAWKAKYALDKASIPNKLGFMFKEIDITLNNSLVE